MTYLLVLLGCLLAVAPLELVLRVGVLRQPRRLLLALLPGAVVFVIWDVLAVRAGHWTYDQAQVLGGELAGLPLEELAFFAVVPLCAVLTLEAVRTVRGR